MGEKEMVKEIPRSLRIMWLINAIVSLMFSFFYIVILEAYTMMSNYPYLDPIRGRAVGVTLALLGIFSIIAATKEEWEQVKLYFEFLMVWIAAIATLNILALLFIPLGSAVGGVLAIIVILVGFLIPYIYFYVKLIDFKL